MRSLRFENNLLTVVHVCFALKSVFLLMNMFASVQYLAAQLPPY
jgi:hypothetical protein